MSKRKCECYAQISKNDPRYAIWIQVDPEARVPLKHPLPVKHPFAHPQFDGDFYEGDPSRLTEEQKEKIIELMSKKFKVSKSHVREGLDKGILPIKGDNVMVSICSFHVRCML